jgi:hypothetical protein
MDFVVRRTSPFRRQLCFTNRGLRRLELRAYHVFSWRSRPGRGKPYAEALTRAVPAALKFDVTRGERVQRLRHVAYQALREYLLTPCAIPDCPCIVHKHGLLQVDVVAELLSSKPSSQPYSRARPGWYVPEPR